MENKFDQRAIETLSCGVKIYTLQTHKDSRGNLTEIFREEWTNKTHFIQWNYVSNNKNILRGVHVHPKHQDFLIVISGTLTIGILDLRKHSASYNKGYLVELTSNPRQAIMIPTGVAHGFYSNEPSAHIYGVDHYWNMADELGCHWQDTKEYIPWPCNNPELSARDQEAQSLESLRAEVQPLLKGVIS